MSAIWLRRMQQARLWIDRHVAKRQIGKLTSEVMPGRSHFAISSPMSLSKYHLPRQPRLEITQKRAAFHFNADCSKVRPIIFARARDTLFIENDIYSPEASVKRCRSLSTRARTMQYL